MDEFSRLLKHLNEASVRFLVIGIWGANYYALDSGFIFHTSDRDLFLPPDAENLLRAWIACEQAGYSLWVGDEPLGKPLDKLLASRVVERRALVAAFSPHDLRIDLSLVMKGFNFKEAWDRHRIFVRDDLEIHVASLSDIVESKRQANRAKDKLFLASHADELEQLLGKKGPGIDS